MNLNIETFVRAREAIGSGLVIAVLLLWTETILLIGIPVAIAQLMIAGISRRALARNCRQLWRIRVVIALALLFCVVAGGMLVSQGGLLYFTAMPLIVAYWVIRAVRAMRTLGAELDRAYDPAFLARWIFDIERGRTPRGRHQAGMPRARFLFTVAALVVSGILAAIVIAEIGAVPDSFVTLCILIGGAGAGYLIRRGRRHLQAGTAERRQVDMRAPVLLLRSFKDDQIRFERFSGTRPLHTSFEQIVSREYEPLGPVIAIGEPDEALPPLGAAREHLRDADWQTAVEQLMREARLMVFVLGETEGLLWEVRTAVQKLDRRSSLLILLPPLKKSALNARWQHFRTAHADLLGPGFPETPPGPSLIAIAFLADVPVFIQGNRRRTWDYRLAIRLWTALQSQALATASEAAEYLSRNAPSVDSKASKMRLDPRQLA